MLGIDQPKISRLLRGSAIRFLDRTTYTFCDLAWPRC
jgi:hypothetical protein